MAIEKEIVDRLLANYEKPEDLTGENGVLRQLTKALMERALEAEMPTHLGYERHDQEAKPNGNRRNGKSKKTLKGDFGEIEIATPRDREATFEARIIAKGQTRGLGRQDPVDVCAWHDHARHPGAPGGDLRGHSEPDPHQQRHRCGAGRSASLAEPAAGCGIPDRVPGCPGGQDA